MSNGISKQEALIRAWEKTVDVQQHFNDLGLRVRNFAVTVVTAVLGAAVVAFREAPKAAPWILVAGVLAWLAFYMMDAFWYHRLLLGSVAHGEEVEKELKSSGLSGFGLAGAIKDKSPVDVWIWRWYVGKWHSTERLHGFYLAGIALFALFGLVAWTTQDRGLASVKTPQVVETPLSEEPVLLFPPAGSVLKQGEVVVFGWELVKEAERYELEVKDESGKKFLSIPVPRTRGTYAVGADMLGAPRKLSWRSVPTDRLGKHQRDVGWVDFELRGGG